MRTVAEALKSQAALQQKVVDKWTLSEARTKTLSTIRIPPFDGHPSTTVKAYRDWKKDITTLKILNKLTDEELALVLYTSFTGRTKQLVECLEILEIRGTDGLERMWQILDDAFEQMGYERMADAWKAWETAHRATGQPMTDFIAMLRKIKLELVTQDQLSHISEEGFTLSWFAYLGAVP